MKHRKTYCFENQTPLTENKHVDNMTHNVDANTQNRSSYPVNLRLGKNDISPFPPSPALSNNKVSKMSYVANCIAKNLLFIKSIQVKLIIVVFL